MSMYLAATLLATQLALAPAPPPPAVAEEWAAQPLPDQKAIEEAVRQALDEQKDIDAQMPRPPETVTLRSAKYEQFAATFSEAAVPGCLRPDGLKRQPTGWGPFQLTGILRLPFVLVAKVRGKCN